MTIEEGLKRVEDLKRLAKNVRWITQYFLNEKPGKLEEIADKHGIDRPIKDVMSEATEEMYALAESAEKVLMKTVIESPAFPLRCPDAKAFGTDTEKRGVFQENGMETHYV